MSYMGKVKSVGLYMYQTLLVVKIATKPLHNCVRNMQTKLMMHLVSQTIHFCNFAQLCNLAIGQGYGTFTEWTLKFKYVTSVNLSVRKFECPFCDGPIHFSHR